MPRMSRRQWIGAGLVAGANLVAAPIARKPRAAGLPPLQDPSAIRRAVPPAPLPPLSWTAFAPGGAVLRESPGGLAGDGLVLNFWAEWCDPCVREMPALASLAAALRPSGIAVRALAAGGATPDAVRAFYARDRIGGLPVAIDAEGEAGRALGIDAIPVTLLIDRSLRLVARAEGAVDWVAAAPLVRRLLA